MFITWLDFREILLETSYLANFLQKTRKWVNEFYKLKAIATYGSLSQVVVPMAMVLELVLLE